LTLRLITDSSGVPLSAPVSARGDLGLEAFEQLFNNAGCMLAIFDGQARFVAVNDACARVLGCPPSELVGQCLLDHLHPHDPASASRISHAIVTATEAGARCFGAAARTASTGTPPPRM
jgi:PAS domain-containing protein